MDVFGVLYCALFVILGLYLFYIFTFLFVICDFCLFLFYPSFLSFTTTTIAVGVLAVVDVT